MSEKTLAEKLVIKPGTAVWVSERSRLALIGELPSGVTMVDDVSEASTGLIFAEDSAGLDAALKQHATDLARVPSLWVAYPKGNRADINRDTLWPMVAPYGMRPISQVAVDEVWSALRFRPLKPGEPQFTGGR